MYTILSVPLGMQRLWKIRVGSVVVELGCCVIIGNDVEVCLLRLRQHFLPLHILFLHTGQHCPSTFRGRAQLEIFGHSILLQSV